MEPHGLVSAPEGPASHPQRLGSLFRLGSLGDRPIEEKASTGQVLINLVRETCLDVRLFPKDLREQRWND